MNHILVPTAFTYLSKCALNLGLEMAKLANARMHVLSAMEPNHNGFMEKNDSYSQDPTSSVRNIHLTEKARTEMHARAEEISAWFPDQTIYPKIVYGDQVELIAQEVVEEQIDLLIMGGDLYDPADDTSSRLIRTITAPVVILKCMISGLEQFNDIILLADEDKDSDVLISELKNFQDLLQAKIHVLHVNTPKKLFTKQKCAHVLETYVSRHVLSNFKTVSIEAKTEQEGLLQYCETIPHAFVAMGMHERGFMRSMLSNKAKKEEIIANSVHPVWAYRG